MRANSKDEVFMFVKELAECLGIQVPGKEEVVESVIYMDNLGCTWVNEKVEGLESEKGESLILKEFSSFRTPLGDEVVKAVTPSQFFTPKPLRKGNTWPRDIVNPDA